MDASEFIRKFQHCPYCGQRLLKNPYFESAGAVYCEEHGDFFAEHGRDGLETCVVFRPYRIRKRGKGSYRRGNPDALVKCVETGIIYPNLKRVCEDMGLNMGNLSRHMQRHPRYRHVKGFTFVFVHPSENPS